MNLLPLVIALLVPSAYHVSPAGSDAASGKTLAAAFRTIGRAAALARPGDTVLVHPGTYRETVRLEKDGEPKARITLKAVGDVVVSGADPLSGFTRVGDGVYRAPMPWSFTEKSQSDQLFEKGTALELLRWPKNKGSLVSPTDARVVEAKDAGGDRIVLRVSPAFDEPDGRWNGARVWVNLSHLGKNWGQDGQAQTGAVVSTDRATGTIVVSGIEKRSWEGGKYDPDKPWGVGPGTEIHLFNPTPEGLKATGGPEAALAPGEWWRDGAEGQAYVRPRGGNPTDIEARKRAWAFDLDGRSHVTVDGFRVFAASITTDQGAEARSSTLAPSTDVVLRNLRMRYLTHFEEHTGQFQMQWLQKSGIRLSGTEHLLESCVLEDSAGPAVSVIGVRNRVLGNTIRRANYSVSEAGCIDMGRAYDPAATLSQDHEIGWNTIEDSPQQGINLRGLINSDPSRPGLARVHHNVIRRVMARAYDSAAIDQFGTDGRGVRIDHNVISDMTQSLQIGIYVDFGFGYVIDHNLITNVERPIQINHNDPNKSCRVFVDWNTCLSSGGKDAQPGVLNGVGDVNPDSSARYNLSTKGVQYGKDAEVKGNVTAESDSFVDASKGDYRPATSLGAGAFEFGKPAWKAGASAYPGRAVSPGKRITARRRDVVSSRRS